MADRFRITLAQLDAVVGDLAGNADKALAAWEEGRAAGADLVMLPEMWITGYQTQDLVMKPAFAADAMRHVEALAARCAEIDPGGPAMGVGGPRMEGARLHNAYWILKGGRVAATVLKHRLPNETVFDEVRLFEHGPLSGPVAVGGVRLGVPICEDAWHPDVAETLAETGAQVLLVPNGSPYYRGKFDVRMSHMVARVVDTGLPLVYLNLVGAQDDQMFDGGSFVLNPHGELAAQLPLFEECVRHVDFERVADRWRAVPGEVSLHPGEWEQDYRVMVEATRGYFAKTGFSRALLGLSGGVDSALVAAIAADALGPGNVRGVMLPSRYTSRASLDDAAEVARRLGIALEEVPIAGGVTAVHDALEAHFSGTAPGIAEENLQSRLRGLLADGAVEQDRGDAAHDGQQVRGRGRVRHDLRRHVGRLQPGEGPVQDAPLRDLPLAQPGASPLDARAARRGDPQGGDRQAAHGGAPRGPARRGFAAALSGAGRHPRAAGGRGPVGRRLRGGRPRPGDGAADREPDLRQRVQALPIRAGPAPDGTGVLARPALPDRQSLARPDVNWPWPPRSAGGLRGPAAAGGRPPDPRRRRARVLERPLVSRSSGRLRREYWRSKEGRAALPDRTRCGLQPGGPSSLAPLWLSSR